MIHPLPPGVIEIPENRDARKLLKQGVTVYAMDDWGGRYTVNKIKIKWVTCNHWIEDIDGEYLRFYIIPDEDIKKTKEKPGYHDQTI